MPKNPLKNRRVQILLVSLLLMLIFDYVLFVMGDTHLVTNSTSDFHPSDEPTYLIVQVNGTGPNYFFPVAKVDVSFSNLYANEIRIFDIYMSLDNLSWTNIPFSTAPTFVDLGEIPLNSFNSKVYVKCYFPPQTPRNQTVPIQTIEGSFKGSIDIEAPFTSQTWIIMILLSIALFSFVLQILDFSFGSNLKSLRKQRKDRGDIMDLETQILNLLSKNLRRDFTIYEVYQEIYGIKLNPSNLRELHYKINPTVGTALDSLLKKGQIDIKLTGSPRIGIVYQLKQ